MDFSAKHIVSMIGLCAFVYLLSCPAVSSAQQEEGTFVPIKDDMQSIAQENDDLARQNRTLRIQLVGLQLEIDNVEEELRDLDPGFVSPLADKRERTKQPLTSRVYQEMEKIEDAELAREAKEIYLSGEHMDLDDDQKLRELELYDLAVRKEELELDLKEKSRLLDEIKAQRKLEFQSVERQSKTVTQKAEEIGRRLAEAEKRSTDLPQEIEMRRMENQVLQKEIEQLRDELIK